MILLDTNVVSETMRDAPAPAAIAWYNAQDALDLFIPSISIAEIAVGIARLAQGARRDRLDRALAGITEDLYFGRIVAFDLRAAQAYGDIAARRRGAGRPMPVMDCLIAATALSHGATLATRNVRDFEGLDIALVDPFDYRP